MSFIANGSPISITYNETQNWFWKWSGQGWLGITVVQPQPVQPLVQSMSCAMGGITANGDGSYSVNFSVTNLGPDPEPAAYNIQISLI
jgi:hypothetical protein